MMNQRRDPKRQWQGRRSRELGLAFEERLKIACEAYKNQGVAHIEKTPEPFAITDKQYDKKGKFLGFLGHFEKKAQPDFKGTLQGGKSIVFDAKATEKDRIDKAAVTDEQRKDLNYHFALGAECYIVVSIGLRTYFRVPWYTWEHMREVYGRNYITVEELTAMQLPEKNGIIYFLEGVNQNENRKK
jgi:recombination protein U